MLYFGANKLKEGAKLLLVLTADGVEGRSDEVTIQPSPTGEPRMQHLMSVRCRQMQQRFR